MGYASKNFTNSPQKPTRAHDTINRYLSIQPTIKQIAFSGAPKRKIGSSSNLLIAPGDAAITGRAIEVKVRVKKYKLKYRICAYTFDSLMDAGNIFNSGYNLCSCSRYAIAPSGENL